MRGQGSEVIGHAVFDAPGFDAAPGPQPENKNFQTIRGTLAATMFD